MTANKKGITPIIAIVLLLMITISMVGFAWIWFQRLGASAMESVSAGMNNQTQSIGKIISIDNANGGADSVISIRNIGTQEIKSSEIGIYVDGNAKSCAGLTDILPGQVVDCTIAGYDCAGKIVKVTAPGNYDEIMCS